MEYAAFLLGINLGTRSVKMADLKKLMEDLGYTNVRTVIASGNVRFEAGKEKPASMGKKVETALEKKYGFKVGVILRTMTEIEKMLHSNPFKNAKVTKNTRRYVTFLTEPLAHPDKPRIISKQYRILKVTPGEVYSHLELTPTLKTPDIMKEMGTSYGKKITIRNWNTIGKIAQI